MTTTSNSSSDRAARAWARSITAVSLAERRAARGSAVPAPFLARLPAGEPCPVSAPGVEKARHFGVADPRVHPGVARLGAAVAEVDEPHEDVILRGVRRAVAVDDERTTAVAITGVRPAPGVTGADHARGDRLFDRRIVFSAQAFGDERHLRRLEARGV